MNKRKIAAGTAAGRSNGGVPSWVGAHPFPPGQKKPVRVSRKEAILFSYGKDCQAVSCTTHISTNCIQVGVMIIPPAGTFNPPDIHSGHEVYYIKSGKVSVLNPESGLAARADAGDFLWIPKGIWHQGFNVGEEMLEVVAFIAPLQWQAGDAKVPEIYSGPAGYFCGSSQDHPAIRRWPHLTDGPREKIQTITAQQALNLIAGPTQHYPVSLYVSNELIHVGRFQLPAGRMADVQKHEGDKVLYVLEGCLGVNVYEGDGTEDHTIQDLFEVYPDQAFLVPGGLRHRYRNCGDRTVQVLFGVAPAL